MYTIKQAAERTGIPAATLRAWERRYAVLRPPRSAGGYRLYDDASIRDLEVMKGLVALGHSPRQAAVEVTARRAGSPPGQDLPPGSAQPLPPIGAALDAARAHDIRRLSRAAEVALASGPLPDVVGQWLFPLVAAIGDAWAAGEISVATEHGASHVLMRVLAEQLDAALPASSHPDVLVGLPRGARHEIGALAFAAVAAQQGMSVAYLGADLPAPEWLGAVVATGAPAAVVAVPLRTDVRAAREAVAALTGADGVVIGIGGGAQSGIRPPGVPLGHDLQAGVDRLRALLRPRPPGE